MSAQDLAFHYVCTWDEARALVDKNDRYWISNCGCRERQGSCKRSRLDVCLIFNPEDEGSGSDKKEVARAQVEEILKEAETKYLVARPFRVEKDMTLTGGICFCCDDCCGYFLDPTEKCDRGRLIESTNFDLCTHCGICVDVCYFLTRTMVDGKLTIDPDFCFGCGLCVPICPEKCIDMVARR